MTIKCSRAFTVLATLFVAVSLWAHHSPSAVFDMSKRFTIAGTLTKIDWINPHIVIDLDVKGVGTLTLSVDFGRREDVGDRIVWADPTLIRGAIGSVAGSSASPQN